MAQGSKVKILETGSLGIFHTTTLLTGFGPSDNNTFQIETFKPFLLLSAQPEGCSSSALIYPILYRFNTYYMIAIHVTKVWKIFFAKQQKQG